MAVIHPRPYHPHRQHFAKMAVPSEIDGLGGVTHPHLSYGPDRVPRFSFSSTREQDSDVAQSFTASRVSSLLVPEDVLEECNFDGARRRDSAAVMAGAVSHRPLTQPHSRLHRMWYPSDHFMGWKEIAVRGKVASSSYSDLYGLCTVWKTRPNHGYSEDASEHGCSTLELLPDEVLGNIISFLLLDVPPNGVSKRNVDLVAMLRVSRRLHEVTLSTLYRNITIPHSRIFQKFLSFVETRPMLGRIVRRLDFSHFNPAQLFATAAERAEARNLTPLTLHRCLELTPRLQEFLAQEYIDEELDDAVLRRLFLDLPTITALDLCGCSSAPFVKGVLGVGAAAQTATLSIQRLSLHKCLTLPSSTLELLLPRLGRLTHLDVAGTRMTDAALMSIPSTARITHLNLAKCTRLTARGVITFFANHPSVSCGLVFLSLASDARSHQLLDAEDVSQILPLLPRTLKSLSLKGAKMNASHIEQLRPHTQHLEELACGRCLTLNDVNCLFCPDRHERRDMAEPRPSLKYIDLSDMWAGEMDLAYLFSTSSVILQPLSEPLEVIELAADDVFKRLSESPAVVRRAGWRISELGSRAWLVRDSAAMERRSRRDGQRAWKMGAEAWGMRKIPVAVAEVGGMYGSFMFARKL